jgi:hypothetical protein
MVTALYSASRRHSPTTPPGLIALAALMLIPTVVTAEVTPQINNEQRVAIATSLSGDIVYSFDASVNKTNAHFKASVAPGSIFSRIFSSSEVNTVFASYEVIGRPYAQSPDAIRFTLISDEYKAKTTPDWPPVRQPQLLTITLGETVLEYPLGIAERVEAVAQPRTASRGVNYSRDGGVAINASVLMSEVHIERTATARIPVCEFLSLVNQRSVRGTVAGLSFELSGDALSGLRRFAAEIKPSAAAMDAEPGGSGSNCPRSR